MDNIINFPLRSNSYAQIAPLIEQVCLSSGLTAQMTLAVIAEYKQYYLQLSAPKTTATLSVSELSTLQTEQLNHACHIILSLLIKANRQI